LIYWYKKKVLVNLTVYEGDPERKCNDKNMKADVSPESFQREISEMAPCFRFAALFFVLFLCIHNEKQRDSINSCYPHTYGKAVFALAFWKLVLLQFFPL
jgi:hypothetical protein